MLDKLSAIEQRYSKIERLLADPEVSADYSRVQGLLKEIGSLKSLATLSQEYRKVVQASQDARTMSRDQSDRELADLAREELDELEKKQDRIEHDLRIALLPEDPIDEKNVVMEIRAGTGGDEAGLFAADLFRMYLRYTQRRGWKIEVVNSNESGLGSIKEVVFQVKGEGAYGQLKHESGGHRVQRIPITESGGRIHTSAATVAVLPEADEVDVNIKPEDIQIDIYHASGHGGQNVQKVATAVRITHKPTGIAAICQDERSQYKNKEKAMAVLRSRVLARELQRQQDEISEDRRSQVGSGDRSERIRTYNYPQDRVTDHRVSLTTHGLEGVLDGDLYKFTDALVAMEEATKIREAGL
jgi:peptide chain release factor 1